MMKGMRMTIVGLLTDTHGKFDNLFGGAPKGRGSGIHMMGSNGNNDTGGHAARSATAPGGAMHDQR